MGEVKAQRSKIPIDRPIPTNMNPRIGRETRVKADVIHLIVCMIDLHSARNHGNRMGEVKAQIDQPIRINMNPRIGQESRVKADVVHLIVCIIDLNSRVVMNGIQTDPEIHLILIAATEVPTSTTKQEMDRLRGTTLRKRMITTTTF